MIPRRRLFTLIFTVHMTRSLHTLWVNCNAFPHVLHSFVFIIAYFGNLMVKSNVFFFLNHFQCEYHFGLIQTSAAYSLHVSHRILSFKSHWTRCHLSAEHPDCVKLRVKIAANLSSIIQKVLFTTAEAGSRTCLIQDTRGWAHIWLKPNAIIHLVSEIWTTWYKDSCLLLYSWCVRADFTRHYFSGNKAWKHVQCVRATRRKSIGW